MTMLHNAVHGAVNNGCLDIVETVLGQPNCNIDDRDDKGRTALHHVIEAVLQLQTPDSQNLSIGAEVAKLLVVRGLEYLIADANGETPLSFAQRRRKENQKGEDGGLEPRIIDAVRDVEDILRRAPLWGDNRLNQAQIMANYQQFLAGR